MDRIGEISQKVQSISFLKEFLRVIKESKGIEIELSDQELLTILNEIMPVEAPQETDDYVVGGLNQEEPKAVYVSTEDKIKEAVEYCKANGISLTVRSVAKQAGVSKSTVHNHYDLIMKYTD